MAESRKNTLSEETASPTSPKLIRSVPPQIFTKPPLSRSPSDHIFEDYLPKPKQAPTGNSGTRFGLPHKWRPMSEYMLCDTELLKKHGIVKPEATYNTFNLYIKKKERNKENPTFYFIKFNKPGSYLSEFESLNAAVHNLMHDGIIPSAHVIFDDSKDDFPPIAICTAFDTSFIPVKKQPITKEHLKDPEIVKCLGIIITLAQLLEECDLHGNNFVWADSLRLMRVDPGQAMWNYLIRNPETSPELKSLIWGTAEDIFPLSVEEVESEPNFKSASPRYCPGGSGKKSIFSDGSSYMTWFSKNAFSREELEVYRDPNNLQKNPDFNFTKFKLDTKFVCLTKEVIKEVARLYLRNGYSLCLISEASREPNKLYLQETTAGLKYEVLGTDNLLKTNTIPWDQLPSNFPKNAATIIEQKDQHLSVLLNHTCKAGHTSAMKEKQMNIQHVDEYAEHLATRIAQLRETLIKSDQFKAFIKSSMPRATHDIFDDIDAFSEKMAKKNKKPETNKAYARLFACQDTKNPQASMTIKSIKEKIAALDSDALGIKLQK